VTLSFANLALTRRIAIFQIMAKAIQTVSRARLSNVLQGYAFRYSGEMK
jgi:hypothetical protein